MKYSFLSFLISLSVPLLGQDGDIERRFEKIKTTISKNKIEWMTELESTSRPGNMCDTRNATRKHRFKFDSLGKLVDKTSKLLLDSVQYEFRSNGFMIYKDLESQTSIDRTSHWTIKGDILFINELKRPFKREAKILELSGRTLIMAPIIDGRVGESKMIFSKM